MELNIIKTEEQSYSCERCKYDFESVKLLQKHMKVCMPRSRYKCQVCFKEFNNSLVYKLHKDMHNKGTFKCEICDKVFQHSSQLKIHQNTHLKKSSYWCRICQKKFKLLTALQAHKERHRSNINVNRKKLYTCLKCSKTFSLESLLYNHQKRFCKCKTFNFESKSLLYSYRNKHKSKISQTYVCQFCKKNFTTKLELNKHAVRHIQECVCSVCELTFPSLKEVKEHYLQIHPGINFKPFQCGMCRKQFANLSYLKLHVKAHSSCTLHLKRLRARMHAMKEKICETCGESFKFQYELDRHKQKHNKKTFQCEVCYRTYQRKDSLKLHQSYEHPELGTDRPFQCDICAKFFKKEEHLNCHKDYVHNGNTKQLLVWDDDRPYQCNLCTATFKRKDHLKTHKNNVHIMASKLHRCETCGKAFANSKRLEDHIKAIHEKKYSCVYCEATFLTVPDIINHDATCHSNLKIIRCFDCGKVFSTKTKLRKHTLNVHMKEATLECDICHQKYKTIFNLNRHRKLHFIPVNGMKEYQCPYCDKSYHREPSLQIHLSTHTGVKPYECNQCDKTFLRIPDLKKHLKTHEGEAKPYICQVCFTIFYDCELFYKHKKVHIEKPIVELRCQHCDQVFNHAAALKTHVLWKHSDRRPIEKKIYMCEYCSKEFKDSSSLKRHIQSLHTPKDVYKCAFCDACTLTIKALRRHVNHNHIGNNLDESVIMRRFPATAEGQAEYQRWRKNKARALVPNIKKRHRSKCMYCSRSYSKRSYLLIHINSVHKGLRKPYICAQCGQGFTERASLGRHMKCHKKQAFNYYCQECDASFSTKKWLKNHNTRFHSNRHLRCPQCGLYFKKKHDLHDHKCDDVPSEPTELKFYSCIICGSRFKRKNDLVNHKCSYMKSETSKSVQDLEEFEQTVFLEPGQQQYEIEDTDATNSSVIPANEYVEVVTENSEVGGGGIVQVVTDDGIEYHFEESAGDIQYIMDNGVVQYQVDQQPEGEAVQYYDEVPEEYQETDDNIHYQQVLHIS